MTKTPTEPLRGEAAYRAARAEITRSNDAARAEGLRRRAMKEAEEAEEAAASARRETLAARKNHI